MNTINKSTAALLEASREVGLIQTQEKNTKYTSMVGHVSSLKCRTKS